MNAEQKRNYVEELREAYSQKEESDLDKLRKLDAKVRRPAEIFAYTFGTVAALVLGVGMCLAMNVIGGGGPALMAVGIVVGVIGIGMATANYFLYNKILRSRKNTYAKEILRLSDACLNQ